MLEKIVFVGGTLITALAIGHAGDAAVNTTPPPAHAEVVRASTPQSLRKKLDGLEHRLAAARTDIDALVKQLGEVDDARVHATRTRLALLYRLESGLVADIDRTKHALAAVPR